jgi:hypothetical protein
MSCCGSAPGNSRREFDNMECLIGGAFVALLFLGFILWLGGAIQGKQGEGQAPAPRQKSEYGGHTRTVRATPRQRAQAAQVKASDRAIQSARRQALKGTPRGTAHIEPIKPVSYEGKTVNGMCLSDTGDVLGYVALDEVPLDWE